MTRLAIAAVGTMPASTAHATFSGANDLVNATIDSGRNLVLATARTLDDACLSGGSVLQARTPAGQPARIYLTGIRGTVFDDGTVDYAGALFGPPLQPGVCLTAP